MTYGSNEPCKTLKHHHAPTAHEVQARRRSLTELRTLGFFGGGMPVNQLVCGIWRPVGSAMLPRPTVAPCTATSVSLPPKQPQQESVLGITWASGESLPLTATQISPTQLFRGMGHVKATECHALRLKQSISAGSPRSWHQRHVEDHQLGGCPGGISKPHVRVQSRNAKPFTER